MVPAVRPLRSPSMARGCARIDSGPDTAKKGSADRVEVHHARLLAVIGVPKTFPHGLGQKPTASRECSMSASSLKADIQRSAWRVRKVPKPVSCTVTKEACSITARARPSNGRDAAGHGINFRAKRQPCLTPAARRMVSIISEA